MHTHTLHICMPSLLPSLPSSSPPLYIQSVIVMGMIHHVTVILESVHVMILVLMVLAVICVMLMDRHSMKEMLITSVTVSETIT